MPLIAIVGRKKLRSRVLMISMYAILLIGGLTMIYPFMMTLTGSVSNHYDYPKHDIVPHYLFSSEQQFFKYLADKYYERTVPFSYFTILLKTPRHWNSWMNIANDSDLLKKYYPELLEYNQKPDQLKTIATDYKKFLDNYKSPYNLLNCYGATFKLDYSDYLKNKYRELYTKRHPDEKLSGSKLTRKALDMMNKKYKQGKLPGFEYIEDAYFSRCPYHLRNFYFTASPNFEDYYGFVRNLPTQCKAPVSGKLLWNIFLNKEGVTVEDYNRKMKTNFDSINQIPYLTEKPKDEWLSKLWIKFHEAHFPLRLVRLKPDSAMKYRQYLAKRFKTIKRYNKLIKENYSSFANVPFYKKGPENQLERNFWNDFVNHELKIEDQIFLSPEKLFQDQLKAKYGTIEELNQAWSTSYSNFSQVQFPIIESDYYYWKQHSGKYLFRFLTVNYVTVFKFMATRGRALFNTVVLVVLTIFCTLTVNPLAAYALSRYRLKNTQKILIFFLATMAFPPAVTMIPAFLLMRDLALLNTYGALILPHLANAYSIFLLKGFFDSLPQELYEAATMDGASEIQMFWTITLQLTTPILAVLSLNAFVQAYGGFMWAFVVCQKEEMWTLMVWLYQFQAMFAKDPQLVMAALVMASIPTFILFTFCQKIILRGIVVPSMK